MNMKSLVGRIHAVEELSKLQDSDDMYENMGPEVLHEAVKIIFSPRERRI